MPKPKSPLDILKLLDKSNCGECGERACMAFAAAVFRGVRDLGQCPRLDSETILEFGGKAARYEALDQEQAEALEDLKKRAGRVDFEKAAERLGAALEGERLVIKCLGKDFRVDKQGRVTTDIHVNPWVVGPVLNYLLHCKGVSPSGKWVPMRELEKGRDWHRLFGQTCEKPIKKTADEHTDLFEYMVHVFSGRQVEKHYDSDISVVLRPLPLVPVLICYWKPEDGLESNLNLFFDSTAEANLNIESLYTLGAGMAHMFEKIALTHGFKV